MRARRGLHRLEELCSGPGKLTQALGVGLDLNATSLLDGPIRFGPPVRRAAGRRGRRRAAHRHHEGGRPAVAVLRARQPPRLAPVAAGPARLARGGLTAPRPRRLSRPPPRSSRPGPGRRSRAGPRARRAAPRSARSRAPPPRAPPAPAPAGCSSTARTFPLICTATDTRSSARSAGSASGNGAWTTEPSFPRRSQSSSAMCGANGASIRTSQSAADARRPRPPRGSR